MVEKRRGTNVEFFVFRINKLSILKNREWGMAEVKLLSFVTGQDVNLPDLSGFQREQDAETKRQLIRAAAQSVLSAKTLIQVENVRDGHVMTFGDTGYALYTADKIPVSFNWSLLAFELDDDIQEIAKRLDAVLHEPGFDAFSSNVIALAGAAANPAAELGAQVAKFVFSVVTENLIRDRDDQIGIIYQSFNRFEHYPHGERKRDDVPDLSNNMLVDYTIFGTAY
jgi:hypothetical protein